MSLAFDFAKKVALITGSSSGIGAATALLFAKSGANIVVTGRNRDKVSEVANECRKVSPNSALNSVLEVVADVTKREDLQRLVDSTVGEFGRLDILVNNAGAGIKADITDDNFYDSYRKVFEINLDSVVMLTHMCVKHLEVSRGNIINISSIRSVQTSPLWAPYCMSKTALDMFTKCLAAELGSKGIRVNSVNPGAVKTNFSVNAGISANEADIFYDEYAKVYPVGRYGNGSDIANAVLYLAAAESSFVTGTNLMVDGGHLAANVNFARFKANDK